MLPSGSRVNENIVYEHHHELIQVGFKDPVHKVHEGCRGIGEAKGHDHELVVSISGTKRSLGYILILDSKSMHNLRVPSFLGVALGAMSIQNSPSLRGGKPEISLGNTSRNSFTTGMPSREDLACS